MKKLSVIIPVLNEEQIIEKKLIELNSSLSNFLKQSEFEFIIINNGSKDKTEQILNDLLKKKIILGLNAFHADSSAAILVDNEIVAAVEEKYKIKIEMNDIILVSNIKDLAKLIKKKI